MTITKTAAKTFGLPVGSANFFEALAADAGNWSGQPLIDGGKSAGGYTAKLVAAGLISSNVDGDDTFAYFTPAGVALAAKMGHDLSVFYTTSTPTVKVCKKDASHGEHRVTKSGSYCYTCDRIAAEAQKAARAK